MNERTDMAAQEARDVQTPTESEQPIRPAVDIFEDETGITVHADMPGVSREGLELSVDGETLSIEGRADIPVQEGMHALYADVRSTRYARSFSLSRELDVEKIDANLKHGVLTLRIPKREEHKPRKIELKVE